MLASRLHSAGIECEIRNESQVIPGLPFQPELWVVNDTEYEDAARLIGTLPVSDYAAPGSGSDMVTEESFVPLDCATLDAIMSALYASISGPSGQRDWDRFRMLFYPGARLLRTIVSPQGEVQMSAMDLEGFIAFADPFLREHAFYERELVRQVDQFGQIAQVFSSFDSSTTAACGDSLGRGINSVQLWFDNHRWWVMNMLWDDERVGNEIPPQYLP